MRNHKSAFEEETFVSEQIMELLSAGCVTETNQMDVHVISPLGVVRNGSKKRLILDLRYVNKYLRIPKFKYEDIRTAGDIFSLGDWFFKFDYKLGYHHVVKVSWFQLDSTRAKEVFCFFSSPFWAGVCPLCFHKSPKSPC